MSQNEKICNNCNWFKDCLCHKEPRAETKSPDDFCSYWTPKMLNEILCSKGTFLED